jgi:Peptidase family M23
MTVRLIGIWAAVAACASAGADAQINQGPVKPGQPLIATTISQGYAVPWVHDTSLLHVGLDLAAPRGDRVFAVKAGKIVKDGQLGRDKAGVDWGAYLIVQNDDGSFSGYLHVNPILKSGSVAKGQQIATVFRDHLHLNDCLQLKGCQRGAFTNPDYPKGKFENSDIGKFYRKPKLKY